MNQINNAQMKTKNAKAQYVQILGRTVRIGTKKHAILVQQVKIFNDLAKHEQN